jgi:cytochrome b561
MHFEPPAPSRYDPITRAAHWANALLVAIAVALAWCIPAAPRHGGAREWLVTLHMSCGIVILFLMLFWGGWRLRHPAPALRPVLRRAEIVIARTTHAVLYLLLVLMPLSGYAYAAAAGRSVRLFGLVSIPPLLPESGRLAQAAIALHLVGQLLIYAIVALHVSAALMHGVIRRDGILERMLPPRSAR